jgi:Na+/proline symporter
MHTSYVIFWLFWGAVILAALAQCVSYWSIASEQRTHRRKFALALGLVAVLLSAIAGYMAAIDWSELPKSPEGLRSGRLFNDGGIPAIVP